jgi:aspartyl/asparaginyl beta-hydroxylase (cupin superfamily)
MIFRFWITALFAIVIDGFTPSFTRINENRLFTLSSRFATIIPETQPLAPHTFAGMVEMALIERFGVDKKCEHDTSIGRIIESWRLLDKDYVHHEFLGSGDPSESSCYQEAHSFVPGLKAQEFYDTKNYPWCQKLAKKYKDIKEEFKLVTSDMSKLVKEGNNIWASALTDDASSYGTGWKTLVLMDRGIWDPINANLFPRTSMAIRDSGAPVTEAFFASMQPKSSIAPHSDFTNFVVTCHLGLDIPDSGLNKCRLTIGDETRQWINGEVLLFDTSILHEAVNESDRTRYILMLRVWHPDLTPPEKEALQFIYDCLALPNLVSQDESERQEAETQLQLMKSFPVLGRSKGSGFGNGSNAKKSSISSSKKTKAQRS